MRFSRLRGITPGLLLSEPVASLAFAPSSPRDLAGTLVRAAVLMVTLVACTMPTSPGPTTDSAAAGTTPAVPLAGTGAAGDRAPGAGLAPIKMHVAYSAVSGAYIPFYVGQAEGLFAQHGLDVDLSYIATGTVATNSMLTGELQMLGMGGPSTINAVMGGADLVMVGGLSQIAVGSIMVRDPDVQTLADLRGKRLAVSRIGSFIDTTTRRVLRLNNLVPDQDVAMVQAGGVPEIMAAVENGAADGGLLAPPITMEARRAGLQELLDVTALELPTAQSNVVVSRAYLESNRPAVKHFLLAIADAIALSQRDPLETKQVLAHYAGTTDPEALEEGYQLFAQRAMSHVPLVSPQAVAADLESIVAQDPRAANARVERFFDNSVVEELVHDGSIS